MVLCMGGGKSLIYSDLRKMSRQINLNLPKPLLLLYFLHNNRYYRNLFYYRIGPVKALLISWYRPGDHSFIIPYSTTIGSGCMFTHPYSTVLNAESIGENDIGFVFERSENMKQSVVLPLHE